MNLQKPMKKKFPTETDTRVSRKAHNSSSYSRLKIDCRPSSKWKLRSNHRRHIPSAQCLVIPIFHLRTSFQVTRWRRQNGPSFPGPRIAARKPREAFHFPFSRSRYSRRLRFSQDSGKDRFKRTVVAKGANNDVIVRRHFEENRGEFGE